MLILRLLPEEKKKSKKVNGTENNNDTNNNNNNNNNNQGDENGKEEKEDVEGEEEEEDDDNFEYVEKEWVPLSVHFGMPLANPKLTRLVCHKIGKFNLFSKENIGAHTNNSRLLCNKLLDFIEGRQAKDYKFEVMPGVIPFPTVKIAFDALSGKIIVE